MQLRFSMMFSAASLAGAFSGLLAAAIEKMAGDRHLAGWAWIFILVGRGPESSKLALTSLDVNRKASSLLSSA